MSLYSELTPPSQNMCLYWPKALLWRIHWHRSVSTLSQGLQSPCPSGMPPRGRGTLGRSTHSNFLPIWDTPQFLDALKFHHKYMRNLGCFLLNSFALEHLASLNNFVSVVTNESPKAKNKPVSSTYVHTSKPRTTLLISGLWKKYVNKLPLL